MSEDASTQSNPSRDVFVNYVLPSLSISDLATFSRVCSTFLDYVIKYITQLLQKEGDISFLLSVVRLNKTIPTMLDNLLPSLSLGHAKGKAGEFLLSWAYVNRYDKLTATLHGLPVFNPKTGQITLNDQPYSEEECNKLGLTVGKKFTEETKIEESLLSDLFKDGRSMPKLMQAQWALCTYQFKVLSDLLTIIKDQLPQNEMAIFFTLLSNLATQRKNKTMSAFLEAKKEWFLAEPPEENPMRWFTEKSAKEIDSCVKTSKKQLLWAKLSVAKQRREHSEPFVQTTECKASTFSGSP